jgi:hypothetical protein
MKRQQKRPKNEIWVGELGRAGGSVVAMWECISFLWDFSGFTLRLSVKLSILNAEWPSGQRIGEISSSAQDDRLKSGQEVARLSPAQLCLVSRPWPHIHKINLSSPFCRFQTRAKVRGRRRPLKHLRRARMPSVTMSQKVPINQRIL